MKISIAELVRLQKTAHELEDAVNQPGVLDKGMLGASTSFKAASISNFFDSLINSTDITIKA